MSQSLKPWFVKPEGKTLADRFTNYLKPRLYPVYNQKPIQRFIVRGEMGEEGRRYGRQLHRVLLSFNEAYMKIVNNLLNSRDLTADERAFIEQLKPIFNQHMTRFTDIALKHFGSMGDTYAVELPVIEHAYKILWGEKSSRSFLDYIICSIPGFLNVE